MTDCVCLTISSFNPEPVARQYCQQLKSGEANQRLLLISYPFEVYWLEHKPKITLTALYAFDLQPSLSHFTVTDIGDKLKRYITESDADSPSIVFDQLGEKCGLPVFIPSKPMSLACVNIAKPWGQEVWYTGIEERGQAGASDGHSSQLLPWVLSALPGALCNNHQRSLILLKILDPLPEEVFGDLYFELHQEKREVYVVTAVDQQAWPDGEGAIRFGFAQAVRAEYATDADFRAGFLSAVSAYRVVRDTIDQLIDAMRSRQQVELNAPVPAGQLASWLGEIDPGLLAQERELRQQMDRFTNKLPLRVGDVVKVPCLTPHSLQHGVRTIEFQTPVYERLIVSFGQKVLTQTQWDTEAAVEIMTLDNPEQPEHECLINSDEVQVERIVDFEDFNVLRITLQPNARYYLSSPESYELLIGVKGQLDIDGNHLQPEQAMLVPMSWQGGEVTNDNDHKVSFLLASPST